MPQSPRRMRLRAVKCAGRTRRKPPNMNVWGMFCQSGSTIDGTPLRTLPAHSWTSLWTTIFWTPRSWAPQASRMTLKPTTGATRWPPGVRSTCGGSVGARGALGGCLGRSWAALLLNFSIVDVLAAFLPHKEMWFWTHFFFKGRQKNFLLRKLSSKSGSEKMDVCCDGP